MNKWLKNKKLSDTACDWTPIRTNVWNIGQNGYENGDYDLPTAEQQRVNQLIASQNATTATLESLQITVMNGFDALIGLTRGDNYLMSEESGEIDEWSR